MTVGKTGTDLEAGRAAGLETGLRDQVAAVIGVELSVPAADIPPDVDFTALGVSSLGLGRACARLADALGRPVPYSQLFRTPTVRGLSRWLAGPGRRPGPAPAAAGALPGGFAALSELQTYMFMTSMIGPEDLSLRCVATWRVAGPVDRPAMRQAVRYVHRRHEMIRAEYRIFRGQACAKAGDGSAPGLVERAAETEQEARELLRWALSQPFDLMGGLLWQPAVVTVRQDGTTLFGYGIHHLAYDGGSLAVLAGDLAAAYNAYRSGGEPALPPAPGAAQIAAARDAHLRYVDLQAQTDYWRAALDGLTGLDYPGEPEAGADPAFLMLERRLPVRADAIAALAGRLQVSPFTVYLAAYGQAMAELTGRSDFAVLAPVNQRAAGLLAGAVSGLFDMLCLRLRTGAAADAGQAVAAAARVVADAFAARDIPITTVTKLYGVPGKGARNPLTSNMFALQDNAPGLLPLDGVRAEPFGPRQLGTPSELFAEVWPAEPDSGGPPAMTITYRADKVATAFCQRLAGAFERRLSAYAAWDDAAATTATADGHREQIRGQIREFLAGQVAGPVSDDTDIFAAGLVNSLFAVQLVVFVEERFGIAVQTADLRSAHFRSIAAITAFVAGRQAGSASADPADGQDGQARTVRCREVAS